MIELQWFSNYSFIFLLYFNQVRNLDVHGATTFKELFSHDFWGQSIDLKDSHKSYRPLTVITFRMNFILNGLNATGYHVFNVILYSLVCILVWIVASQWINKDGNYI